ncbi:MAG TPA: tyrosinase family protein [Xanthobacteraceae bacterium]|jgi:tyrosinase
MANGIRNRLGVHNLDDAQVTDLRRAYAQMMQIRDNRGYAFLAGLHGAPSWYCWHHQQNARSAQRMELFLPWHRAYLYNVEMAARSQVGSVTLPWWDWTLRPPRQDGIPKVFADRTANGGRNPLASFHITDVQGVRPHDTVRHPGPTDGLPSQADVDGALSRTDYSDFAGALEDVHDRIHGWVSGDMGVVGTAAYDPIFWSHHTMIDRIWWLWQVQNGNGNITSDLMEVVLAPFNFRVRDVLNVNDLGYDYAAAQTVVPIGGG